MNLKSGVYKITCIPTGKFYIGSAVNLIDRKRNHFNQLRNNQHFNSKLQNSWNKHGEANFTFEIIEECEKERLIEREQFYIDTFSPQFNVRKVANSNLGIKRSIQNCFLNGQRKLGNTYCRKAVYAIDPKSLKICYKFHSSNQADKFFQLCDGAVSRSCLSKGLSKGYLCIYVKDYSEFKVKQILKERSLKTGICKSVLRVDEQGNLIEEFKSVSEAANQYNLHISLVSKVCKKESLQTGGMYFKYKEALCQR